MDGEGWRIAAARLPIARMPVMKISVIIPVHNEAENIPALVLETHDVLRDELSVLFMDHEIIVVDDGSDDDTTARLLELPACALGLRVLHHDRRSGQSTALRTGAKHATGDVLVTMDGDGQNDPADIPHLLEQLLACDRTIHQHYLVVGNRSQRRRDSWWRRVSSRIANTVRSRILKDATPDTGCGLKAMYRETFLELPYFDHMHRFLPALVRRHGGRVMSLPVNHRPRIRGRSHYGTIDRLIAGIVDLAGMMWLLRRVKLPHVEECLVNGLRNDMAVGGDSRATAIHQSIHRAVA
jgi:dolichol-phosphate mannosyltransferase